MRELKTEFFMHKGVKYFVNFQQLDNGDVLFMTTGKFERGRKPKVVDSGKYKTKAIALKTTKKNIKIS